MAMCVGLAAWVPPAAAETAPGRPEARPTLAAAAEAKAASLAVEPAAAAAAQEPTTAPTTSEGKSFFKSRKGILAAVLMAAGVGYTFYSKDKDRVRSAIR
jgi:hypothetical protein